MAKYFPIVQKKTIIIEVPVGEVGEVGGEKLQYDNITIAQKAEDTHDVVISNNDVAKRAIESVTAALASELTETNQKSNDYVGIEFDVNNQAKKANDPTSVSVVSSEINKKANDNFQTIIIPSTDQAKKAQEDISNTVTAISNEFGEKAQDLVSLVSFIRDYNKKSVDSVLFETIFSDVAKKSVEDISNVVIGVVNDTSKKSEDSLVAAIIPTMIENRKSTDQETVIISLNGYANSVASNSGFTNPDNSLGNTTGNGALLTATSSGLLGTTNNTTNGTIVLDFRDINLGDIDITSAILSVENDHVNAGVPITQPTCSLIFAYSTDGSTYTNFYTLTGQTAKGIRTIDLTSILSSNKALLNPFRVRATGNVTSGTGVGAASTATFYRAWLTIQGNRIY